jgi:hypothetical protein
MKKNLLNEASKLIPLERFIYKKYKGKVINELGIPVIEYEEDIEIEGSIQALDVSLYEKFGFSFERNIKILYASIDVKGLDNQDAPDKIVYDSRVWSVIKTTRWHNYNGWNGVIIEEEKE